MKRSLRIVVLVIAFAGWLALPDECYAQARCPWLNAATAAGVLGGEVQMAVSAPSDPGTAKGASAASYPDQVRTDRFDVACEFSRKMDAGAFTLSILVKTMSDPAKDFGSFLARCAGTTIPLRGIGNEAMQCRMKDNTHLGEEQVIARVRDRVFVLTIHRDAKPQTAADGCELSDNTRNVAEQVAGSLF